MVRVRRGGLVAAARRAWRLEEAYRLRRFDTLGFEVGLGGGGAGEGGGEGWEAGEGGVEGWEAASGDGAASSAAEHVARAIASTESEALVEALTRGVPRYRLSQPPPPLPPLDIAAVARRAFELNPRLLNDGTRPAWSPRSGISPHISPRISPYLVSRSSGL